MGQAHPPWNPAYQQSSLGRDAEQGVEWGSVFTSYSLIHLSTHLSIYTSIHPSICPSTQHPHSSIHHPSTYMFIYSIVLHIEYCYIQDTRYYKYSVKSRQGVRFQGGKLSSIPWMVTVPNTRCPWDPWPEGLHWDFWRGAERLQDTWYLCIGWNRCQRLGHSCQKTLHSWHF